MENSPYATRIPVDRTAVWLGKQPLLSTLDMELTERCNHNCIHCYINLPADHPEAGSKEISTKAIKEILGEAAALGCLTVRFTGGEPLLREDFKEIYVFTRKLGMAVILFTNATRITPDLAALFTRIPPGREIEVSVYGTSPSAYEAVTRVPGSFQRAMRGIALLRKHNIPFGVKGALLPPNAGETDQFETWAAAVTGSRQPVPYTVLFDLRGRRDSPEKNRRIKRLRPTPRQVLEFFSRRKSRYVDEMKSYCAKFMGPPGKRVFSCGAGIGGASVDAYGRVQPCLLLRHPETGYDLRTGSLKEALTNFFPKVREKRAADPAYLARCARCFLKGLCDQCPAKSWMEHGTLDTPVDFLCELAHAQARYLGLLKAEEKGWTVENWRDRIKKFADSPSGADER